MSLYTEWLKVSVETTPARSQSECCAREDNVERKESASMYSL